MSGDDDVARIKSLVLAGSSSIVKTGIQVNVPTPHTLSARKFSGSNKQIEL